MKSTWIIAANLVMSLVSLVHGFKCPELPLKFKDELCSCGAPVDSRTGGWEKSCFVYSREMGPVDHDQLYRLTYLIKKRLEFDCNYRHKINYTQDLFANVTDADFDQMWFMRCPLPEFPVQDMLTGFNITRLRFYSNDDEAKTAFPENFLRSLPLLKSLQIEHTEAETLSPDFFSGSPRLLDISMIDNNLKHLPATLFHSTRNLTNLNLGGNNLSVLPDEIFANLTKLRKLYLYNNNLTLLPVDCFAGLVKVAILELRNNVLLKLPSDIFRDMIDLQQLGLAGNNFTTLPSGLFRNNTNIVVLNLSKIRFKYLPGDLLQGLTKMKKLLLPDCNMTEIPDDFIYHARNLEDVVLYNNRLTTISPLLFSRNGKLKSLKMERNNLTNLTHGMFRRLYNLKFLSLSKNMIEHVAADAFQDLVKLEKLYLSYNKISTLHKDVFSMILNVRYIDLSHNRITSSLFTHFGILVKLENLNLSFNNLTSMPSVENLGRLSRVDLRKNQIRVIHPSTDASSSVKYLLQYNNISVIDMRYLKSIVLLLKDEKTKMQLGRNIETRNPSTFYISNNPLNCDCTVSDFLVYLKKMAVLFIDSAPIRFNVDKLICASPIPMAGQKVIEMELDEARCSILEKCPKYCKCGYRTLNQTTRVQCENSALKSLPLELPHNSSVIYFRNVSINEKHLSPLTKKTYENVTHLSLRHNSISSFPEKYLPTKLQALDLSYNQLRLMPKWLPKYSKKHTVDYHFGNNPWICDCAAREFKSWLTQNHKHVKDIKKIVCSKKGKIRGVLIQVPDAELCPQNNESEELLISSITPILVLSVFAIVFAVLYYKQKQNIIIFLFTHNMCQFFFKEDDLDEDKLFDAFISYSYHNRDFVVDHLIPELEEKDPHYNLCIHERNFMPGKSIVENIISAIELSRRTVIILSNDFVESDWGMLEFSVAHHQMLKDCINRVVIVIIDELSEKAKSVKELQFFLSTKTYLKKDELWFWDKLKYALPRRPLQQKNKDGPLLVLPNFEQQKKLKPKIDEVNVEINEKIALKLADVDNLINSVGKNSSDSPKKTINGLMNPIFNDDLKLKNQQVVQMEPIGINSQLNTKVSPIKENLI